MTYDEKTKQTLGSNIWTRREVLGLSRGELAERLGVGRETVSHWELGKVAPNKDRIRSISKELKCSINDLFSTHRVAVLNMSHINTVTEPSIEENVDVVNDFDVNDDIVRVSDKLNEYMSKHNLTGYEMAKQSGVSNGTLWRIKNKKTNTYSEPVKQLEKWLDEVDKVEEPKQEPKQEPVKDDVVKGSISDRLNIIYDTLFNSLAELDELKQDIAKIEKVTTLLKQIDL